MTGTGAAPDVRRSLAAAHEPYFAALATGDSAAAVRVALQVRDAGLPVADLLDLLVSAAQVEVGRRWAANEWSIAAEHRATATSEDVVAALAATAPPPHTGRTAVVTCADGEWHALPARVLAASFRHAGWRVTFLGASVPADQLAHLVHEIGPDVVALSCALPTRLIAARAVIELARGAGVPVLVGGSGFGPDGMWGRYLGATAWAPDARSASRVPLPDFVGPAPPLPHPDGSADTVRRARPAVVAAALDQLASAAEGRSSEDLPEQLGLVVDFLVAALFVDDAGLFSGFARWQDAVLGARGTARATLPRWLRAVAAVDAVRSSSRAAAMVHDAAAALDAERAEPLRAGP